MLDMVDVEYIRKLKLVQHWSIRQIASRLDISRNTVTKYLSAPDPTPRYRLAIPRPRPGLGGFGGGVRLWVGGGKERPSETASHGAPHLRTAAGRVLLPGRGEHDPQVCAHREGPRPGSLPPHGVRVGFGGPVRLWRGRCHLL